MALDRRSRGVVVIVGVLVSHASTIDPACGIRSTVCRICKITAG
ncbi:hypothetical protein SGUI_1988 [Serinicoccus hydrothermalis]|uniref:Uncharacterized protein n=1 Tax=Serinicoccus hydrothermalis TaxID=1758689 RepID=A0A1B1ND97_9MICO|nr:hypothetical protein SGUI_1988 [Serinicoccus hydrothermalis]